MGLVFVLQPDPRKSAPDCLVIRSSKKKFGLGGSLLFSGTLVGTMFLAAKPLFKILWEQGGVFDRLITAAVLTPIFLFPLAALACWFYQETVIVKKRPDARYDVDAFESVFGLKWNKRHAHGLSLNELRVENWIGTRNVASFAAQGVPVPNRYATRGHWMLKVTPPQGGKEILLERRAKRDDIDFLKAQIDLYFESPSKSSSPSP